MESANFLTATIEFVRTHQEWAVPIVFLLAFFESLAFLSLVMPATAILIGVGALIGAAGIDFWSLWFAGGIGGVLGYSASYQIGVHFGERAYAVWPFRNHPELIRKSQSFFDRFGVMAVFIGHFIGPVRAVIPVVAGVHAVKRIPFEIANVLAAFIWISSVLAPGFLAGSSDLASTWLMMGAR
ncbi:MAG TPA: DedA family protein [Beijerinckiaceae bacterium]|nr:DedA family protein [Beijerinckiaceae bacterium]